RERIRGVTEDDLDTQPEQHGARLHNVANAPVGNKRHDDGQEHERRDQPRMVLLQTGTAAQRQAGADQKVNECHGSGTLSKTRPDLNRESPAMAPQRKPWSPDTEDMKNVGVASASFTPATPEVRRQVVENNPCILQKAFLELCEDIKVDATGHI